MIRHVFLVFFLAASSLFATPFDAANQQFKSGDFTAAAASYEKILAQDGPNSAVFYNLGNSHQSLKQYGPAILNYERALLLSPRDSDVLANLALARKAASLPSEITVHPTVDAVLNFLSRDEWSWLVAAAAVLIGVVLLLAGAVKFPKPWLRNALVISATFLGLLGAAALHLRRAEAGRGIVTTATAEVRLSPFATAESLGKFPPGQPVQLGVKTGNFYYATASNNTLHGWLATQDVTPLSEKSLSN